MNRPNLRRTPDGRLVVRESDSFSGTCPACGQEYLKVELNRRQETIERIALIVGDIGMPLAERLTAITAELKVYGRSIPGPIGFDALMVKLREKGETE